MNLVRRMALAWLLTGAAPALLAARQQPAQGPSLVSLSLEDLMRVKVEPVFGAAGRLQPATEAPSSVTIVTADDIARYGYRSLAEILRSVRGLYVTYDRNYSYVGARGFARPGDYNTRLLLLVDGHRMNDDVFDQAGIGPELGLDPSTFARVEIIRGPVSALYGANAFLAVINITTKTGRDIHGVQAGGQAGSLGLVRGDLLAGTSRPNGLEAAVSAHMVQTGGAGSLYFPVFDTPAQHGGIATDLDAEDARGLTARLSAGRLQVSSAYGWRRKVVPTASFGALFGDPRLVTTDERAYVNAEYQQPWQTGTVTLRGYADEYRYDGSYPYAPLDGAGPAILSTDFGHGVWWGSEARLTRPMGRHHTLVGGIEFRDYVDQNQGLQYDDNRFPPFETTAGSHVIGVYAQDEWRVRAPLLLNVGVRYDGYSGFDRLSPRASLVWTPSSHRSLKYIFGDAFRAPNAYELDYLSNGVRNTALSAETITTHEIAWEEYVRQRVRTSLSAYWNQADHLLTLVSDAEDVLMFVNAGRITARGIEAEAEVRLPAGFEMLASYAYGRAVDSDTDLDLTNAPRHLGKLRFSTRGPAAGSTLAFELQAMSDRFTIAREIATAHAVAHLTYRQPIGRQLGVNVSVRNLLGTRYADPASEEHLQDLIPQDGRTIRAGLEWTWNQK
jgi:iron complex outermembrane receptor protein